MIVEGQKVSYVGPEQMGVVSGDQAKVLAASHPSASHIQWLTGSRTGQIDFVNHDLLSPIGNTQGTTASVADEMADSLSFGTMAVEGVRGVYDDSGVPGVVASLSEGGYLALLTELAEEATQLLAASVRKHPQVMGAIASLEVEDQDLVVEAIAKTLLADSLGGDDD